MLDSPDSALSVCCGTLPWVQVVPEDLPSKRRVRRAGDRLVDWWVGRLVLEDPELVDEVAVLNAWRRQHSYPLALVMPGLRNWSEQTGAAVVRPAQRLKRVPQIVHKLARHPGMRLDRMQDVAGARTVLQDAGAVDDVANLIRRNWEVVGEADYRAEGRPDTGYRALHLVVLKEDRRISGQMRRVEIQLRTRTEHRWSEVVMQTASRLSQPLTDGKGPSDLVEYFRMASTLLHAQDNDQPLPPEFNARYAEVRARVRPYFARAQEQ